MLALWAFRLVDLAARLFTAPVVRGIQLALGMIFLRKGVQLITSGALFVDGRPGPLAAQHLNLWLGVVVFALVLALLGNARFPAALVALGVGLAAGILGGGVDGVPLAFGPTPLRARPSRRRATSGPPRSCSCSPRSRSPSATPASGPPPRPRASSPATRASTARRPARSPSPWGWPTSRPGLLGAVPMCHGTGGLVAHHRFGARTGGAPVFLGLLLIVLALGFGQLGFALLASIPNAVLGVLLVFAGLELCPLVRSLKTNEEYFVALLITGIALAVPNMAWAFGAGIAVDLADPPLPREDLAIGCAEALSRLGGVGRSLCLCGDHQVASSRACLLPCQDAK